jgi:hypothetical protein
MRLRHRSDTGGLPEASQPQAQMIRIDRRATRPFYPSGMVRQPPSCRDDQTENIGGHDLKRSRFSVVGQINSQLARKSGGSNSLRCLFTPRTGGNKKLFGQISSLPQRQSPVGFFDQTCPFGVQPPPPRLKEIWSGRPSLRSPLEAGLANGFNFRV